MAKCPSLEGRQRKMYKSKAVLLETQVLTGLRSPITHGLAEMPQQCGDSPRLIEGALYHRVQWEINSFPLGSNRLNRIQPLWRTCDEQGERD